MYLVFFGKIRYSILYDIRVPRSFPHLCLHKGVGKIPFDPDIFYISKADIRNPLRYLLMNAAALRSAFKYRNKIIQ